MCAGKRAEANKRQRVMEGHVNILELEHKREPDRVAGMVQNRRTPGQRAFQPKPSLRERRVVGLGALALPRQPRPSHGTGHAACRVTPRLQARGGRRLVRSDARQGQGQAAAALSRQGGHRRFPLPTGPRDPDLRVLIHARHSLRASRSSRWSRHVPLCCTRCQ